MNSIIPNHLLDYKWNTIIGTCLCPNDELTFWLATHTPKYKVVDNGDNVLNEIIFASEDDQALAKLTWDIK
jgi:hypothetical protein